ncbi:Glycosyltransferase involved in cell wall bisynthesis [Paenibacillus sp. UNC496MF]|uniref:glycosyltransferase family 2 protein n=1 Tax=Paenibacillus sp. UNC496MF TaxID=1502753 RepID=UPI0008E8B04F|nr:glycosyltransferase family 2 protein [Paenibacillus sp. UNC496MF]SFI88277.1 Glycosyltransferase involved in cell wall bisynthesis [Paenibacillus sp. UNC496MF]
MEKIPLSVIIMTKNEEKNIRKCLNSVSAFSQIFVVDSGSTDRTVEIASAMDATVVPFDWNGKYPKKKQWCLDNLPFAHDYVLYVDADEEVVPDFEREVRGLFERGNLKDGYFVGFYILFMDKLLKHGHRSYKLVLFNRHKGRFLDYDDLNASNMWEVEGHYQPEIQGSTAVIGSCLIHHNHDSLYDYFHKHNRYSDWEAMVRSNGAYSNLKESQIWIRALQKKLFHKFPLKWVVSFLHSYVLKMGFLDGSPGFHYALARSLYYWQVEIKIKELYYMKERSV